MFRWRRSRHPWTCDNNCTGLVVNNLEILKALYDLKELQTEISCRVHLWGTDEELDRAKKIYSRINDLYRALGGCPSLEKREGWG